MRGDQLSEHILWIAKNVFLEVGFERASMDVIAARAKNLQADPLRPLREQGEAVPCRDRPGARARGHQTQSARRLSGGRHGGSGDVLRTVPGDFALCPHGPDVPRGHRGGSAVSGGFRPVLRRDPFRPPRTVGVPTSTRPLDCPKRSARGKRNSCWVKSSTRAFRVPCLAWKSCPSIWMTRPSARTLIWGRSAERSWNGERRWKGDKDQPPGWPHEPADDTG